MLLRPGPDWRNFAATVWLLGLLVGGLLAIWAWRTEPRLPVRIAGFMALAALLSLVSDLVFIR
jgi:CHASE2 domain-containing sensor protein